MSSSVDVPRMRPHMTPVHGGWAVATIAAVTGATASAPSNDLIITALITLLGGVLIAIIGPFATALARTRFHRGEQKTLNDLLIREMERISDDNEQLRQENEALRDENARLLHRRR